MIWMLSSHCINACVGLYYTNDTKITYINYYHCPRFRVSHTSDAAAAGKCYQSSNWTVRERKAIFLEKRHLTMEALYFPFSFLVYNQQLFLMKSAHSVPKHFDNLVYLDDYIDSNVAY